MIVVSDTSCVSNLITIGQQDLLPALFREVVVPPAVWAELLQSHKPLPQFLKKMTPANAADVRRLGLMLDPGEAEAIALAIQLKAERVLMDEVAGRAVATREGLRVMGVAGLLVMGKKAGLILSIAPLLHQLRSEAGFWLSDAVVRVALESAGEV